MKLQQTNTGSLFVTIPKDLCKLMQLQKGTEVVIVTGRDGNLEIRKV